MFLIKLALRNITRHKRRTILTAAMIALGIFLFLVIDSMMMGLEARGFQNIIDLQSGHMKVIDEGFEKEEGKIPLDQLINVDSQLISHIKDTPHFRAYSPRVKFNARLNNGLDELPIMGVGVNPDHEKETFTIGNYFVEGEMFEKGEYQAVLGKKLASLMGFKVGDYLTLVFKTQQDSFNTIDAKITGLINSPHPELNESMVYIPLSIAQQSLLIGDKVSEVVLRLEDKRYTDGGVTALKSSLTDKSRLTVESWRDSAKSLIAMSEAQSVENQTILGILLIIAAVGIINTVILAALERIEEIGMMKALGMEEKEIVQVFMYEATAIGILGGLIGIGVGAIGVALLHTYGLSLQAFGLGDMTFGLPVLGRFYGQWNIGAFVFVFSFGVIVSLIASIFPARWAAKKDPIKAIYHR